MSIRTAQDSAAPTPWGGDDGVSCPVADTIRMLSGKWKPMILHMLVSEPRHFEQIVRALAPANRKVVSAQLHQLLADGLITRRAYDDGRQRVLYALSPAGHQLATILETMRNWGQARATDQRAA